MARPPQPPLPFLRYPDTPNEFFNPWERRVAVLDKIIASINATNQTSAAIFEGMKTPRLDPREFLQNIPPLNLLKAYKAPVRFHGSLQSDIQTQLHELQRLLAQKDGTINEKQAEITQRLAEIERMTTEMAEVKKEIYDLMEGYVK